MESAFFNIDLCDYCSRLDFKPRTQAEFAPLVRQSVGPTFDVGL